jgi:ABC-type ATPase involved in cell division/GNAT superfamily N-acetyltransferase
VKVHIAHQCPVRASPRLTQVAGMFDLPIEAKTSVEIVGDLPVEDRPWQVGLIVGPSGSGKSSIARRLWPAETGTVHGWPADQALIDGFPEQLGIRDVVGLLTSVGLGSPPAWTRPYATLSNGEAFRADVARALAEAGDGGLAVIDEFTSVVDRQVAQVASHTVQKTVRRGTGQLVAVTCHYDVIDWLQPDWLFDTAGGGFTWRSVQPHPRVDLAVHRCHRAAWPVFARHHYLSGDLHSAAQCFGGWVGDTMVAFTAYRHLPHPHTRNIKMGHRLVVLPDWQGLGIGGRLDDWLGQWLWDQGMRYRNVVAHPAMIAYYARSPRWHATGETRAALHVGVGSGSAHTGRQAARHLDPRYLGTRSFEYRPPRKA